MKNHQIDWKSVIVGAVLGACLIIIWTKISITGEASQPVSGRYQISAFDKGTGTGGFFRLDTESGEVWLWENRRAHRVMPQ